MLFDPSNQSAASGWKFDNSYLRLPPSFYAKVNPTLVTSPRLIVFNQALAEEMGLSSACLDSEVGTAFFSGNLIPEGAEPIAQAYAGHQFGNFTMLGDGRAVLLGEHITPEGKRLDIQLKGAGPTPFSRRGDGRAALGPMLREYILSEAMHALGIPTTRSLAVVATGEPVFRETPLPGAVLTRVAASHIRVGTFEYALARGSNEDLRALGDYTRQRHYPEASEEDNPYLALLQAIIESQASLIAKWQRVGFIHGVMNTDNMALCGETIDYGPCAFMDTYDPATVFSSIDRQGRYAYGNQPVIAHWNLARFAETLIPLLHAEPQKAITLAEEAIATFPERFQWHWLSEMTAKLGVFTHDADDTSLVEELLRIMHRHQADYTNTFRALSFEKLPEDPFFMEAAFSGWRQRWQARLKQQGQTLDESRQLMRRHSPAIIPRNHQVERALKAAVEEGDFSVTRQLLLALEKPYEELSDRSEYCQPPLPDSVPYQTFCGT